MKYMYEAPKTNLVVNEPWPNYKKTKILFYGYIFISGILFAVMLYEHLFTGEYDTLLIPIMTFGILIIVYILNVVAIGVRSRVLLRRGVFFVNILVLVLTCFGWYVAVAQGNISGLIFSGVLLLPVLLNTIRVFPLWASNSLTSGCYGLCSSPALVDTFS